jgi:peptide deformylase
MTVAAVLKMGNQQLGTPSLPVEDFNDPYLQKILIDLQETMHAKGGVGIAAPQIGYNRRIIMFGFDHNPRYPNEKPVPFTLLINPTIEPLSTECVDGWEGCLSVPGLRGLVPRYKKIRYQGFNAEGQQITKIAENFHARVVQHECDHLDGILFPQRIKDLRFFGFEEELKPIIWPVKDKA